MSQWKNKLRNKLWDIYQSESVFFPKPVYGSIPNFEGAIQTIPRLNILYEFEKAETIYVSNNFAYTHIRENVVSQNKKLILPRPEFYHSFCAVLDKTNIPFHYKPREFVELIHIKQFSKPILLDSDFKIDLLILNSLAVDINSGFRVCCGSGNHSLSSNLEYAIIRELGYVSENTPILTIVHEKQVVHDLKNTIKCTYDVPVNIIITPFKTYYVKHASEKPDKIYWNLLVKNHYHEIRCLKKLKKL